MSISLNNEETQDWDNMKPHLREGILKIVETLGMKNPRIIAKPGSGKGDNFMANMYKVKITDLDNAEAKSVNLMMKAVLNVQMNDRRKSHYFIDAHHRERLAYTQLFPKMKQIEDECNLKDDERFVLPKYYASGCEELKEWIILEDISVSGFKMFNKFEEVDRDHAWAIIKEFAKFHALNFAFRQRDKAEYNRIAEEFVKLKPDVYDDYITTVFKMAAAALKDEDEIYKNKVEEFSLRAKKKWFEMITYPNDDQYRILCHFDCWVNNFMYRYEVNVYIFFVLLTMFLLDILLVNCFI